MRLRDETKLVELFTTFHYYKRVDEKSDAVMLLKVEHLSIVTTPLQCKLMLQLDNYGYKDGDIYWRGDGGGQDNPFQSRSGMFGSASQAHGGFGSRGLGSSCGRGR